MRSKAISFVPLTFQSTRDDNVNHINGLLQNDCEKILYDALDDECETTSLAAMKGIEKIFEGQLCGESYHTGLFLEKMIEIYHKNTCIKSYNGNIVEKICSAIRIIGLIGRSSKEIIDLIKDAYFSNIGRAEIAIIRQEAVDAIFRISFLGIYEFKQEIIDLIDKAILDANNNIRKSALTFLIKHMDVFVELNKSDDVINKLLSILNEPNNTFVKVDALKCIGRFAKVRDDVFEIIKKSLFDKYRDIREAAIGVCGLYCLYGLNDYEIPKIVFDNINESLKDSCIDKKDIKYIASIEICCAMTKTLFKISSLTRVREDTSLLLLELSKHKDSRLRAHAVYSIGEIISHIKSKYK